MAKQIRVTLADPRGLDDGKTLREELEQETGIPWQVTEAPDDVHLTDMGSIILSAVLSASMKQTMEVTWPYVEKRVRKAVDWWSERHLDPPEITVEVDEGPDEDEKGSPEDGPEPRR
jgi:hypothetical protein